TNDDPIDHEFILGDQAVQDRHESGTEAHHGAIPTEVSVPAGETVETTVRFDQQETLILGCHLPGHYAYGMKARVVVG
ncbi:MAG TPA: plastocyanin/azurin family copper-binding protein, partial [Actinomycetota bacterium]|nr:plastocyanin/azurin family copper-binding protein [Actinomycetota bacterium]